MYSASGFPGYRPLGDVNGDGIGDLLLACPDRVAAALHPESYAYLIFGRTEGFPANLDLNSLDGSDGLCPSRCRARAIPQAIAGGGAGYINHDGIPDLAIGAIRASAGRPL